MSILINFQFTITHVFLSDRSIWQYQIRGFSMSAMSQYPCTNAASVFEWDLFISHVQGESGAHVLALREAIAAARPSTRTWIDLDEDATTAGMLRGVERSRSIVIILSPQILSRQWCQFEVKKALEARAASHGAVRIVFVAVELCTFAIALAAGRTFSADEVARRDGRVYLEETDFAALVQAHEECPAILFHCDERLATQTAPGVLAACSIDPVPATVEVDAPFRMRRGLPADLSGCDILLVAAPNGALQCSFLRTALGRLCFRRALDIQTLDYKASPEDACAAIKGARHVVCILTRNMWDCVAVREAMLTRDVKTKVSLLQETDVRKCYGGVQNFGDLLDQRPASLASLFDDNMARVFERKKSLRGVMLEQLLRDAGAVASDSSGGSCPPPRLPRGYREKTVRAILDSLEAALAAPGILAVATGGMGGAGKTTVATALATRSMHIRGSFDDILWVSLGSQVGRVELLAALERVIRELEDASGGVSTDDVGSHYSKEAPVFDSVEAATRRLRELFETRRVLLIVDDVSTADHFLAFLGAVLSTGGGRHAVGLHASKLLFTTRDLGQFTRAVSTLQLVDACNTVTLDQLSAEAAREFVATASGILPRRAASLNLVPIFAEVGTTLLSLSIVSGVMRTKLEPLSRSDRDAEVAVVTELNGMLGNSIDTAGRWIDQPPFCDALASRNPSHVAYMPLYRTIDLSLRSLFGETDSLDFAALSLFPKGYSIAESLVSVAWRADRDRTRTLLVALQNAGLVKFVLTEANNADGDFGNDGKDGHVTLHDLALDFASSVVSMQPGGTSAWHANLLHRLAVGSEDHMQSEVLKGVPRSWWSHRSTSILPQYIAEFIFVHLSAAGLHDELLSLASSLPWLQFVLKRRGMTELLKDFTKHVLPTARFYLETDVARGFQLLYEALRLSRFALERASNSACDALAGQMVGRLPIELLSAHSRSLGALHAECLAWRGSRTILMPMSASLTAPGGLLQTIMEGHQDSVTCQCLLLDSSIVSGSSDHKLRVWNSETGACERVLEGHTSEVSCLCMQPNGCIVSGSSDHTLRVWDSATGACERVLEGHTNCVSCVCVLPDGRILSGSSDKTIRLWSAASALCEHVFEGHTSGIRCMRTLPDGRRIVSGSSDKTLRVWDLVTGACERVLYGHNFGVSCVCVLLNGRILSGARDSTLRLWDSASGTCECILEGHTSDIICVCTLPGYRVVSGSADKTLRVWNSETGACERVLEGHTSSVSCVDVLPDGRILSASSDHSLRVWHSATGSCDRVLEGHASRINCMGVLPDNHIVSGSSDSTLCIWDAVSPLCERVLEGHSHDIKCSCLLPDGCIVSGSSDKTLRVWDSATGACKLVLKGHNSWVRCVCVLPGGRIVSGSDDHSLRLWDPATGACERVLKGHTAEVKCICFLSQVYFASGSSDHTLRVWSSETGVCERVLEGHAHLISCMCILLDGRIVSGSADKTLRVWDSETSLARRVLEGHTAGISCVCVLPDGRIVSGSRDHSLRVWDATTGACEYVLTGHTDCISCICVLPKGCLVSGSADKTLRIWNAATGACEFTLVGHTSFVTCVCVLPNGCILSGSADRTLCCWDTATGLCEQGIVSRTHPDSTRWSRASNPRADVASSTTTTKLPVSLPLIYSFGFESSVSCTRITPNDMVFVSCESGQVHFLHHFPKAAC